MLLRCIHAIIIRDRKPLNYSAAREGQPGLNNTLQLEDQRWEPNNYYDHACARAQMDHRSMAPSETQIEVTEQAGKI